VGLFIHKPIRPAQLLESLCRALGVQSQREKKAPLAPTLDGNFARRMPLRVLLADDNPINQKVGLSVLHKLGYRADVVNNGLEVMKSLQDRAYDVLFLDVQMPEMDGLECARQICDRWTRDRRPVIIAMTGNALLGDREKCLASGMDDYISKPVRIAELQAALERWGPTKARGFETTYLARSAPASGQPGGLIDESILSELHEMAQSDGAGMVRELIDLFLENAPPRIAQIQQSMDDPAKLSFHAHALKSMSLNLGCKLVVELSQQLEQLGRSGEVTGTAPEYVARLEAAFLQTKAQLLVLRGRETPPQAANL
jgi:CheY-like chemotaxis protein/HPt (histidine-containing phosphotransfer) domain-containing protein